MRLANAVSIIVDQKIGPAERTQVSLFVPLCQFAATPRAKVKMQLTDKGARNIGLDSW
jgi:hypothetical protein